MPGDHRGDKYRVLGWLWLVFVVVVSCDRVGLRRKTCVCALTGRRCVFLGNGSPPSIIHHTTMEYVRRPPSVHGIDPHAHPRAGVEHVLG